MNPLAIFWLWRIGGVLVLTGLITAGYFGWRSHERGIGAAPYIQQIKDNNDAAAAKLAELTDKINVTSKQLKLAIADQEKTNATNLQIIASNNQRPPVRMRDPYKTGSSGSCPQTGSTGNTESSAGNGTETPGLFSEQTAADIWSTDLEADRINVAYIACRAYAYKVRAALIAQTDTGGIVLASSDWVEYLKN